MNQESDLGLQRHAGSRLEVQRDLARDVFEIPGVRKGDPLHLDARDITSAPSGRTATGGSGARYGDIGSASRCGRSLGCGRSCGGRATRRCGRRCWRLLDGCRRRHACGSLRRSVPTLRQLGACVCDRVRRPCGSGARRGGGGRLRGRPLLHRTEGPRTRWRCHQLDGVRRRHRHWRREPRKQDGASDQQDMYADRPDCRGARGARWPDSLHRQATRRSRHPRHRDSCSATRLTFGSPTSRSMASTCTMSP